MKIKLMRRMCARMARNGLWLALAGLAGAASAQTVCVYDPLGAGGDYYSLFQDYQLTAKRWGVNLELKAFSDDDAVNAAFKSGQCDMASMIGMRAREFNKFTGTIDGPGVLENYNQVRDVMNIVASPKLGKTMINGPYEVVGVLPVGAAYPVVNDRSINSWSHAAGKRVAVMEWDKTQSMMAEDFKTTPVPMSLTAYGKAFNSGQVDVAVAPIVVYKAFEMDKGVGSRGGIVRRPLFELTMQLIARRDRFPESFGQQSREYMARQADHALGIVHNVEDAIDKKVWIYAMHGELTEWNSSMHSVMEKLSKNGYFDERMITLLKRVRCKSDVEEPECAPTKVQQQSH